MRIQDIPDQQILGGALVVLGLALGGAAAIAGPLAVDHMALTGPMCGPTLGHCIRCVAAVALLVAAVGVSGAGAWLIKPRPTLSPAT